eukprot:comp24150_c1_seq3/m.43960 comp24150_c1_seq3/g.43960  ORF comp24150_c1_seq3/g.43960 comp24150_c1_seq3/m.43960 type:complete len:1043 (-) comp24150_c1_seq3:191-3319(-)
MNRSYWMGCDAVEFDNVDCWLNKCVEGVDGSELYQPQIDYNRWLAEYAHSKGMAVGLKNDLKQIKDLVDWFDFAINEDCFKYEECHYLRWFYAQNKAVFGASYRYQTSPSTLCSLASEIGYSWIVAGQGRWIECPAAGPTCVNVQFECPGGSVRRPEYSIAPCPDGICTEATCCMSPPKCSDKTTCPHSRPKLANFDQITCTGDSCTLDECCEGATCASSGIFCDPSVSPGAYPDFFTAKCFGGPACQQKDCCLPAQTCSHFQGSCMPGTVYTPDPQTRICTNQAEGCSMYECCVIAPNCGAQGGVCALAGGGSMVLKENAGSIICTTATCSVGECCDEYFTNTNGAMERSVTLEAVPAPFEPPRETYPPAMPVRLGAPPPVPLPAPYQYIDGNWNEWGPCSQTCGKGIRTRQCNNPPPKDAEHFCQGMGFEICNPQPCDSTMVDGMWSPWSACDAPCGGGISVRTCDNPPPAYGGAQCPGESLQLCNADACPTPLDGSWSAWTDCSKSCGGGLQMRFCANPEPAWGGRPCEGEGFRVCNPGNCSIPDVNECEKPNICPAAATCFNTYGSFDCSCNQGYKEVVGMTGGAKTCTNINECLVPSMHTCDKDAGVCFDTPGTFYCTCKFGYTGDGTTCEETDVCKDPIMSGCSKNADCVKGANATTAPTCTCREGYQGDGRTCTDISPPKFGNCNDVTGKADFGQSSVVVEFTPDPTDNEGVLQQQCTPASGSQFPAGKTSVTCTATDAAGNNGTCSFTVNVIAKDCDATVYKTPNGTSVQFPRLDSGQELMVPCPSGSSGSIKCQCVYGNQSFSGDCVVCDRGHSCSNGTRETCPAGKFQDEEGKAECKVIPDGYFCAIGQTEGSGTACVSISECPAGYKCTGGTKTSCGSGQFQDRPGQGECIPIGPNRICVAGGNDTCTLVTETNTLQQGQKISSQGGRHLQGGCGKGGNVQADGNFVLYENDTAYWSTNTHGLGIGPWELVARDDGNVVLVDSRGTVTWQTYTAGQGEGEHRLVVEDDGNRVVYEGAGKPVWQTVTHRGTC